MKNYLFILIFIFNLNLLFANESAHKVEAPKKAPPPPVIRIMKVNLVDQPPFAMLENGKAVGIYVDIINELAREMGEQAKIEIVKSTKVKEDLTKSKIDLTIMFALAELETKSNQSSWLFDLKNVLIPKKTLTIPALENSKNLVIGRLSDTCDDLKDSKFKNKYKFLFKDFDNYEDAIFDFNKKTSDSKHFDAICTTDLPFYSELKKLKISRFRYGEAFVYNERSVFIITKKDYSLIKQSDIESFIIRAKKTGLFTKIFKKYIK